MVIGPDDRLGDVLARDQRALDVLVGASPELHGLRNPVTRKVMGRLATIRQIANMAGMEPDILIRRLNQALRDDTPRGGRPVAAAPVVHPDRGKESMSIDTSAAPAALARIPEELIHELDVRPDLREGREPFSRIMAARHEIPEGGALRLRAIFEPVPLYIVMAKQGFDHWTERLADDDWIVWFYPRPGYDATPQPDAAAAAPVPTPSPPAADPAESIVVLDVRGMEPPEPMVRTLAALESLPPESTLLQINERVPQFLLPKLAELGFSHEVRIQEEGVVRVFIRRAVVA